MLIEEFFPLWGLFQEENLLIRYRAVRINARYTISSVKFTLTYEIEGFFYFMKY